MTELISGLSVSGNKKTKIISVEFPYGPGTVAEFDLTIPKAKAFCLGLMEVIERLEK